jgi:formylglycine-generating enzyme required for sulfatase activity
MTAAMADPSSSRARIFISYRREDTAVAVGRLAEDLRRHFSREQVFQDFASIDPGADFTRAVRKALETCAALLVVIGPRWLTATDRQGRRRLALADDWVRHEVAEGLKRPEVRVFPVLLDTDMPSTAQLPEPLRPLARRQAVPLTARHWASDVAQLVEFLKSIPGLAATPGLPMTERLRVLAQSGPRPGTVVRDSTVAPEMVVVPAGEFLRGSPEDEEGRFADEGPRHRVTLAQPFAVGKHAVTFEEWDACVAAGGSAHQPGDNGWGRGRQPVIYVSWVDAQDYVSWLSRTTGKPYRLLSEAEWEYASRAGTTTRYPWGSEPGTGHANFDGSGSEWSGLRTAPVGSFLPNAFGLHDMIGNVGEWVQDCWRRSYDGAPTDGRACEAGSCRRRVFRGGFWNGGPGSARVANRSRDEPDKRYGNVGFRVARTL